MKAGCLSFVQQTLTAEAVSVLNQAIAEAGRRSNGQTTPLHVAATLLTSPTGYLRQACIRSNPNSSHPLQCRALELCFSVALDRLPTTQNAGTVSEPPISNALMAALKRAQANQRRGCPELQQQPLLAVKVEVEQLTISILDDPSVSRVMREASFSSPAVKAVIENHLSDGSVGYTGIGPPRVISNPIHLLSPAAMVSVVPHQNIYLNPRLQQGITGINKNQKEEDVKKVLEIMKKSKNNNPVLVGDAEAEALLKELLRKIANKELENNGVIRNVQVISLLPSENDQLLNKIAEVRGLIEIRIKSGSVILNLGDLKSFVDVNVDPQQLPVLEMMKVLQDFKRNEGESGNKVWIIATANCETYLRSQVHHPTMETDWDLQAFPVVCISPSSVNLPR